MVIFFKTRNKYNREKRNKVNVVCIHSQRNEFIPIALAVKLHNGIKYRPFLNMELFYNCE